MGFKHLDIIMLWERHNYPSGGLVENYRISSKIRTPKKEDSDGQGKDSKIIWRRNKFPSLTQEGKGKCKVHPIKGHEYPEVEYRYSFTLSLTSALDGVDGQCHAPAALPPGKTRYPLYRRLGGPQGRSGRVRKISPPPVFDPRTVQPVASRYTDWAIPAMPNARTRRKLARFCNSASHPNYLVVFVSNCTVWLVEEM